MRWRTRSSVWIGSAALFLLSPPSAAQLSGGVDLGLAHPYVWRGITQSNSLNVQPAVWMAATGVGGELAGGIWSAFEPWRAAADELTVAGRGDDRLAEIDYWLQYTRRVHSVDVTLGGIHYAFAGDQSSGGRASRESTTELYLRLWPDPSALPVEPSFTLYHDLDEIQGSYLDLTLARSVPVLPRTPPIPLGDLVVRAATGISIGQDDDVPPAGDRRHAARDGLTHLDLSVAGTITLHGSTYLHLVAHHQWSWDQATRRVSAVAESARRSWIEGGLSVVLGPVGR